MTDYSSLFSVHDAIHDALMKQYRCAAQLMQTLETKQGNIEVLLGMLLYSDRTEKA